MQLHDGLEGEWASSRGVRQPGRRVSNKIHRGWTRLRKLMRRAGQLEWQSGATIISACARRLVCIGFVPSVEIEWDKEIALYCSSTIIIIGEIS